MLNRRRTMYLILGGWFGASLGIDVFMHEPGVIAAIFGEPKGPLPAAAIAIALVTGVGGSVAMAAALRLMLYGFERSALGSLKSPITGDPFASPQLRTLQLYGSAEVVFARCESALASMARVHIHEVNRETGKIEAWRHYLGGNWRDRINVQISPMSNDVCQVAILARSRRNRFSVEFGSNYASAEELVDALTSEDQRARSSLLRAYGAQAASRLSIRCTHIGGEPNLMASDELKVPTDSASVVAQRTQ